MCGNPPEKTAWGSRVPRLRAYEASYKRIRVLVSTVIKRDHTASVIMWVRGCPPSVPWRQRERRTYFTTVLASTQTERHGMRNQVSMIPEKIRGSCPGGWDHPAGC